MRQASSFLRRETEIPVTTSAGGMALSGERTFAAIPRNVGSVIEYLKIPPDRVIELGTQGQF